MKSRGILHGELSKIIAELGHGQAIVVSDYGLPIPNGVPMVDLAVSKNVPSFIDVLSTVMSELQVERAVVASELRSSNPPLFDMVRQNLGVELGELPHDELKDITREARVIIRTGEWTPFANVVLYAGVAF